MTVYKGDQVVANGIVVDEGTTDYTELENKPQINGVELSGNKSATDLNLVTSDDIPTAVSELTNDTGYITNSALTDYALKTELPTNTSDLNNDSGYITNTVNNLTNYTPTSTLSTNYVNTTSDQTINGRKVFIDNIVSKSNEIDLTTPPTTDAYYKTLIHAWDKNGQNYGSVSSYQNTNNDISIYLQARREIDNEITYSSNFGIVYSADGKSITTAPHPDNTTSTTSRQLMTVGAMNDASKNYNIVHRSGDEEITGTKTLLGTTGNSGQLKFKNNAGVGQIYVLTDGLFAFVRSNDSLDWLSSIQLNTDGSISLNVETEADNHYVWLNNVNLPAADNSDKAATTSWVNSRITSIMNNSAYVPADTYQDIELTSSGQTIIAPGNGYLCYNGTSTTNAGCYMLNTVNGLGSQSIPWQQGGGIVLCSLPVKSGDQIKVVYGGTKTYLRFIPLVSVN